MTCATEIAGPTSTGDSSGAGWTSVGPPLPSPAADTATIAPATTASAVSTTKRLSGTSPQCTSDQLDG